MMASAPRPLVAGNWKMNGLPASIGRARPRSSRARATCRHGRPDGLSAGDADCAVRRRRARLPVAIGGAGLPRRGLRRLHRRYFGRNAQGCRRQRRHRRPFGAPRRSPRDRRRGARQGAGRLARGTDRDRLRRRDQAPSARPGTTLDVVGAPVEGSLPDGATAANLVVAYEPVWAIGTGLTPTPADVAEVHGFIREQLDRAFRCRRAGHAHPLWRLGEARRTPGN